MKRKFTPSTNLNQIVERPAFFSPTAQYHVHFSNISDRLIEFLVRNKTKTTALVGCQYWFSEERVLNYLALQKLPVQFIVQKQRIWQKNDDRKIAQSSSAAFRKYTMKVKLRDAYDRLVPLAPSKEPVRCLGICSKRNQSALLHHKFIVLLHDGRPWCAITGSFNLTANAGNNLENLLIAENEEIAQRFYNEWLALVPHSESLDFKSPGLPKSKPKRQHSS